ncbi:MAG TPA: organomercurial lyase [Actinomycetota bacterium]
MVATPGDAASFDRAVRVAVYRHTVAEGAPPSATEIAQEVGATAADVETSLRRLADGHVLVLTPGTASIWMAAPFSAIPTPFSVAVGERRYFANCIWDALGIPACLHEDARIDTHCPDCAAPLRLEVRDGTLEEPDEGVIHFAVPAARWWDDIGST